MRASLLDVNVLIALLDDTHQHHRPAFEWFLRDAHRAWLTCPITQLGAMRILSSTRYSPGIVTPSEVLATLQKLVTIGRHAFVSDHVNLLEPGVATPGTIPTSSAVTDCYLLALAVECEANLVTFDRRIAALPAPGVIDHLVVLEAIFD